MIVAEATGRPPKTHLDQFLVPKQRGTHSQPTVLLAEDNDDLRYVMQCSLEFMGYGVIPCANGATALAQFHITPTVDILLTDYDMPLLTGVELARELTACSPSLPIMMISGSCLSPAIMQELHDRRWSFISKPCFMPALQATLRELLDTHHPVAA